MGRAERIVLCFVGIILFALAVFFAIGAEHKPASTSGHATNPPLATDTLHPAKVHAAPLQYKETTSQTDLATELSDDYVGAPTTESYPHTEKYPPGTTLDLNEADTTELQKVPGIGATFATRIVKLRARLGGYYTVLQLQEVYGMDAERFRKIKPYFFIGTRPYTYSAQELLTGQMPQHPYLNYKQRNAVDRFIRKNGVVPSWSQISRMGCFTQDDSVRLSHYFPFGDAPAREIQTATSADVL